MQRTVCGVLVFVCCFLVADAAYTQDREPPKRRAQNAFIGFGLGISGYWPDTSSLSSAFTAIENFYRDQGWPIPGHGDFNTTPLVTYSMRAQLSSPFGLVLEAAHNGGDHQVDALSATLLVELSSGGLRPYVGAGVTDVSFEFSHTYNAQISPDQGSGYSTLDNVTASGSSTGANIVGGIQFVALHGRFVVQASYWWIPEMSDDFGTGVTTTMNLSSFLISIQAMATLP